MLAYFVISHAAGWFARLVMKGSGSGVLGNLIIGVIGTFIGGYLFGFFTVQISGLIESLITATVGVILLVAMVGLLMVGLLKRG